MEKGRQTYVAKTLAGLEGILAEELHQLGAADIELEKRAVSFKGDLELLYRANYGLRTALRINLPLLEFQARTPEQLYNKANAFDWLSIFERNQTFAIDFNVSSKYFSHSQYAALKLKDAIVDYFQAKLGRRPSVDRDRPDIRINLRIHRDTEVVISLESSGESLHKRGYRAMEHLAPLNEVLAAGILQLSGWDGQKPLYDFMCGSGTILHEAVFLSRDWPAASLREQFGFEAWKNFDAELWDKVQEEMNTEIDGEVRIIGSDKDRRSLEICKRNLAISGADEFVDLSRKDFFQIDGSELEPGVIIMNPPYDDRLELEDAIAFYRQIGDKLKFDFPGFEVWILTSNLDAAKHIGLKPDEKIELRNAANKSRLLKFSIYEGSKSAV